MPVSPPIRAKDLLLYGADDTVSKGVNSLAAGTACQVSPCGDTKLLPGSTCRRRQRSRFAQPKSAGKVALRAAQIRLLREFPSQISRIWPKARSEGLQSIEQRQDSSSWRTSYFLLLWCYEEG